MADALDAALYAGAGPHAVHWAAASNPKVLKAALFDAFRTGNVREAVRPLARMWKAAHNVR